MSGAMLAEGQQMLAALDRLATAFAGDPLTWWRKS